MAIAATMVWEVEPAGLETNSGGYDPGVSAPGTDYTQQTSPQISFTDLAIGSTNTQVTSAAHPFGSTHPGNTLNVPSGIANFTAGIYEILSVSGSTATLDRAIGTASSTQASGTITLGGAFASPGMAMSVAVQSNTIYVQTGTYVFNASGTTANVAGGRINVTVGGNTANNPFQIIGYQTNRNLQNSDTPPEFDVGAGLNGSGSFLMMALQSNYCRVRNVKFRNPNGYGGVNGVAGIYMNGVYGLAERIDIDCGSGSTLTGIAQGMNDNHCYDVIVQHATSGGFISGGAGCTFHGSIAQNNSAAGFTGNGTYNRCVAFNNTGGASDGFNATSAAGANYIQCTSHSNGRHGYLAYYDTKLDNCIAWGNGGWGVTAVASGAPLATVYMCAVGGNTSGGVQTGTTSIPSYGIVNLTTILSDPCTNAAGGNFNLNNTTTGGLPCKGVGYPQRLYTLNSVGFADLGALQSNVSATITIPMAVTRVVRTVKNFVRNKPPAIVSTPAPLVVIKSPPRIVAGRRYPQRQPPGIIPGANILVNNLIPVPAPPRIVRQKQLFRLPAGRPTAFIGAATSGILVLQELANVFRFDPGSTAKSVYFKIRDVASGQAKKGLTATSPGANAGYVREQGTSVNIPLVQLVTPADPWSSGGFIEVDPTNNPGVYRLDIPNAALATGADFAVATMVFTNAFDSSVLVRLDKSISNLGPGGIAWTIQVNNTQTNLPLPGALVWVSTDQAGNNVIAGALPTNLQGQVTFLLNAGTYYVWVSDPGYTETNPTTINVS